jgi:hypothetical protein
MPDELNLDQLKLKTADQLRPNEKEFLKQNVDKLNDEDKDAYRDFLETPAPEVNANESVVPEVAEPVVPAKAEPEPVVFKTEAEAKAFVEKVTAEREAKAAQDAKDKQAAIDAAKTPEEKKYVDENWKPKDWNEGIKTAAEAAADILEQRQDKKNKAEKAQREALEKEWDGITEKNKLPARSTPEGQKILKAVFEVGTKYNQRTFTEAFELYSKIPVDQGGGYDPAGVAKAAELEKGKTRREAAAKVTGASPAAATKVPIVKDYQTLHNTPVSKLIRDAQKAIS